MKWLRLYDDVLDDPKAQQMSPVLFKHWINLLCLASKSEPRGTLPAINDVAFRLRVSPEKARSILNELVAVGMIDRQGETLQMHNWTERQPNSDDVAARVRKHREAVTRNDSVTLQKRDGNVLDTDKDIDTDIDTPKPPVGGQPSPTKSKRGTQAPDDFTVTDEMRAWAAAKTPGLNPDAETEHFLDHHRARGTTFKDWTLAWQTWMRNGVKFGRSTPPRTVAPPSDPVAAARAEKDRLLRGQWDGQREALMYAPKSDGPENVARRIAELDRIINGEIAA